MRKQTDLAKVKQTALALLSTEINKTPYSPMIVKHPFTDTGVSAIPDGKGGVEMIDLTEDDAQLRWRQSMARQIDKAESAYAIYMMVTKPYALTFLKFAMPHYLNFWTIQGMTQRSSRGRICARPASVSE